MSSDQPQRPQVRTKLQGQPVERPGAFSLEQLSLGLAGAIAWCEEEPDDAEAKEAQPAQPEEEKEDEDEDEDERERQEKRPRLGRPPPPPPPPPSPLACAPREPARPTAPAAPTAPTATRKGKRSAGSEVPMCMELGRLAAWQLGLSSRATLCILAALVSRTTQYVY